jgi:hypothetical protein
MAWYAPLVEVDRAPLGTICIYRQPRSQPQWRSGPLPGGRVRSGRLGAGAASRRSVEPATQLGHTTD